MAFFQQPKDSSGVPEKLTSQPQKQAAAFVSIGKVLNPRADSKLDAPCDL